jgi:hypothetical protein
VRLHFRVGNYMSICNDDAESVQNKLKSVINLIIRIRYRINHIKNVDQSNRDQRIDGSFEIDGNSQLVKNNSIGEGFGHLVLIDESN